MHAGAIEGLHGEWRKSGKGSVVLDGRMVVRVVSTVAVPAGMVVLKGLLVMVVFVIHLQLAHAWLGGDSEVVYGRGWCLGAGAFKTGRAGWQQAYAPTPWCLYTWAAWVWSVWARACMHA